MFLSLYVLQLAIAENMPESNSLPLIGEYQVAVCARGVCVIGDKRKVGIGLAVFLSLYVLQLAIAENMPESNSLPLIGE